MSTKVNILLIQILFLIKNALNFLFTLVVKDNMVKNVIFTLLKIFSFPRSRILYESNLPLWVDFIKEELAKQSTHIKLCALFSPYSMSKAAKRDDTSLTLFKGKANFVPHHTV